MTQGLFFVLSIFRSEVGMSGELISFLMEWDERNLARVRQQGLGQGECEQMIAAARKIEAYISGAEVGARRARVRQRRSGKSR